MKSIDYSLYAVSDRGLLRGRPLVQAVEQAILGGATVVQLREKTVSTREFVKLAQEVLAVVRRYRVPLIINDRIDVMLAVDADGVHVGQDDMPSALARKLIGPEKILGVSVETVAEARAAVVAGADYLGAGAVFVTPTKADAGQPIGLDGLRRIKDAVGIPVVAIGGINAGNLRQVRETGVDGVAVVSAIFGREDIRRAAAGLAAIVKTGAAGAGTGDDADGDTEDRNHITERCARRG